MLSKLRNCKPEYLTFAVCLNIAAKTTSLLVGPSEKSREQPAMTTRVANQNTGFTSFCPLREGEGGGGVSQPYDKHVLGICPPTPPLRQHFALCEKCYCWLRGWVGGQFHRNI